MTPTPTLDANRAAPGVVPRTILQRLRAALPTGRPLPDAQWAHRHQAVLALLWLHAVGLAGLALARGNSPRHALLDGGIVAAAAIVAGHGGNRRLRSVAGALGLVLASAVFVHVTGGLIEAHFHFFVMIAVLTLYQDWLPFLVAIGFVLIHHGVAGWIAPSGVYNHYAAINNPWKWAAIHASFVLAASVANLVAWRVNEEARVDAEDFYARLQVSEDRFRTPFFDAAVGQAIRSPEGQFLVVNSAYARITGYSEEELLQLNFADITHRDDLERNGDLVRRLLAGEIPSYDIEKRYLHKTGNVVHVLNSVSLVRNEDGEPRYVTSITQDISERNLAEAALRSSEERTRLIIDTASDAFVGMDRDGVITDWNRSAERTFGWSREEAIGRVLADTIIPPDLRQAHTEGLRRFLVTGEGPVLSKRVEVTALRRDGTLFPVELSVWQLRSGDVVSFQAFVQDISERKRMEDALEAALEQAMQASKHKSNFLANMSHELRTPMNGVIGMTALLLDTDLEEPQRRYAETVRNSSEALLTILNDILDFSKIEAGKLEFEVVDFDMRSSVEEVAELVAAPAFDKGLELVVRIPPDMPTELRGDPGRLRQILTNLVGNAVKFTHRGEVVVEAELAEETDTHAVIRFQVRDTGVGIPPEMRDDLFQPFVQADSSTTRKYGGTGLGLAICRQLVELAEGECGVESEVGVGSTFWFTVRMQKSGRAHTAAHPRLSELQGLRVLVVCANRTNGAVIAELLDLCGLEGRAVCSGTEALEALRDATRDGAPFGAAVIDMQLPDADAFDVARLVEADKAISHVRLVLLGASGRLGEAKTDVRTGFAAYLAKPVRQRELFECLANVTGFAARREFVSEAGMTAPSGLSPRLGRRVLLAEDNVVNQKVAVAMLEKHGCSVDVASDGVEAVEAMARGGYELVLMDCQMPRLDGFEATAEIRDREGAARHTPIVAMTASAMPEDRAHCLAAGMDDYLSKPVNQRDLLTMVTRWATDEAGATAAAGSGAGSGS